MNIRQQVGKGIAYFLGVIVFTPASPILVPVIAYTNARGYADKYAHVPGIREGGGILSGIAAFAYVAVLVGMVGGGAVATTTGFAGLTGSADAPEAGSTGTTPDGDDAAGSPTPTPSPTLSSIDTDDTPTDTPTSTETPAPTPTESPSTTPTDKPTPTPTAAPLQTQTAVDPADWSRERKYAYFRDNYTDQIDSTEVVATSINASNESMTIVYRVDLENDTDRGNQTMEVIADYAATAYVYQNDTLTETLDQTWVPNHVNVTAVGPNGQIYYTGYVRYLWAYQYLVAETMDGFEYLVTFYGTTEGGPAEPDYEEAETATNESAAALAPAG